MKEIEHFFVSYNAAKGKVFEPLGAHGPAKAWEILKAAIESYGASARRSADRPRRGGTKKR